MLTLGIPGSPTAAVLLGGLLIWGLQPGPMLFVEQKDFVWGLIASMYLGNIVGLIVVLTTVPWWAAILRVPFAIIGAGDRGRSAPSAPTPCTTRCFDVVLMLVFGVLGYLFKKLELPARAAGAGAGARRHGRGAASVRRCCCSQGSLTIFWSNPLVGSITTLALVMLLRPAVGSARARRCAGARCARTGGCPEEPGPHPRPGVRWRGPRPGRA
ncbi:MAG UNVERIFIED_CONTAM: tripartite tricarboxylate transporter permease [Anaerolineae bacterium]